MSLFRLISLFKGRGELLFVLSLILLAACAAPLSTPTVIPATIPSSSTPTSVPAIEPTLAPTPTSLPPTPSPALSVTVLPDATKSYKQVSGRAPFTVTFSATVSGGVPPYTYAWDFDGDNKLDSSSAISATIVYTMPRAYNAALTVRDAAGQETHVTQRIVAFTTPTMPTWKYGINAHLERRQPPYYTSLDDVTHAAQLMQDAGVQAVRMDFNWDMLNPAQDEWKFDGYDAVVKIARAHNLAFLGILDYSSWWASSAQDSQDWRVRLYSPPLTNYSFAKYSYETVSHFKNDVHVWEVWNEPNTIGFWKPKPDPAGYVALLQEAYLAIKYADPDAVVLFAGMSSNGIEGNDDSGLASDFIEHAYQAGAHGYFDAMAIHPYMLPTGGLATLRDKISATRAVMNQNDDANTPLWLTEMGVPTDQPWWQTAPIQTEQDAANWLKTVYTGVWDLTPTIFWYELRDYDLPDNPEAHFGILRADLSPKPAYDILKALTK